MQTKLSAIPSGMTLNTIIERLKRAWDEELTLYVEYTNSYGVTNEYVIWDVEPDREYGNGKICRDGYIQAFCGTKDDKEYNDTYTFKIDRFESVGIDGEEDDDDDDW